MCTHVCTPMWFTLLLMTGNAIAYMISGAYIWLPVWEESVSNHIQCLGSEPLESSPGHAACMRTWRTAGMIIDLTWRLHQQSEYVPQTIINQKGRGKLLNHGVIGYIWANAIYIYIYIVNYKSLFEVAKIVSSQGKHNIYDIQQRDCIAPVAACCRSTNDRTNSWIWTTNLHKN